MSNPCSSIKWLDCIRVDDIWTKNILRSVKPVELTKTVVRAYSLQFSGTQQQINALVEFVSKSIVKFVLDEKEIDTIEKEGGIPYQKAMKYFGDTNPDNDGKYGELILFLFAESILKTPMIAHKITLLTNTNDQVKGGDGIYFGDYRGNTSLLIGEAKIETSLSSGLSNAFKSLDRFHDDITSVATLNHELVVANNKLRKDFTPEQLDYLYNSLTIGSEVYKKNNLVHPILIIYDDDKIKNVELEALNSNDAENKFSEYMDNEILQLVSNVNKKLINYTKVATVYLDFFFLPVSSVHNLRYALYEAIHSVKYQPKPSAKKTKKKAKEGEEANYA